MGDNSNQLISDLISGTEFNFIGQNGETGKGSLSDKPKVATPIHALNCLLGGGLPLGAILEIYGPNASGKSSLMYETLGNFQRQYPNGVSFIIDSEASTDDARLRALGVDPSRAPRMGANTLEDGFEQIIKILKRMIDNPSYKGFPVIILWDTIAGCPTRAQVKTGEMYGGGMAEKARILKTSLTNIFPLIEKQNVLLVLLNQVIADIGGYRPGESSAGGNALRHDVHMRLKVDGGTTEYDGIYPIYKHSKLSVEKSKVSPIMQGMNILIDIRQGGIIDRAGSLVWWMVENVTPAIFKSAGGWFSIQDDYLVKYKPYWDKFGFSGKFRQKELYEKARNDENFVDFLQLIWLDLISANYTLQKDVCKEMHDLIEARLTTNIGVSPIEIMGPEGVDIPTDEEIGELEEMLNNNN